MTPMRSPPANQQKSQQQSCWWIYISIWCFSSFLFLRVFIYGLIKSSKTQNSLSVMQYAFHTYFVPRFLNICVLGILLLGILTLPVYSLHGLYWNYCCVKRSYCQQVFLKQFWTVRTEMYKLGLYRPNSQIENNLWETNSSLVLSQSCACGELYLS